MYLNELVVQFYTEWNTVVMENTEMLGIKQTGE